MIPQVRQTRRVIHVSAAIAIAVAGTLGGCSSSSKPDGGTGTDGGPSGSGGGGGACTGGPFAGAADTHCGTTTQATGACRTDVASAADAGAVDYGDTMNGTEGDDDDCKYHVVYSTTPVCDPAGATFTVTVTTKADPVKPVTGAAATLEAFLSDTHLSPTFKPKSVEKAGGVYDIGPVKFDRPGIWTVRFHFFETCSDTPADSPHGHAAFFINVP
jgi:hypothetical protein